LRAEEFVAMRICLYTDTALPKLGGQEIVVDALARQFRQLGHNVKVLAPHPRRPLRARDNELPYSVVRHPRFYSTRAFVAWYRWWLGRLFRAWPFDVLHCHGIYPPGYLAALLQPWMNVPVVITSHGGDVHPGSIRVGKPVVRRRAQQGLAAADALIAISRFTRENYLRLCPAARNIVSIPNGVDLAALAAPQPRPADLDATVQPGKYLLFLGRLAHRKGVDVLLQALALLPTTTGVQLVIAGDGDARGELQSQCTRLGLNRHVSFLGAMVGPGKAYLLQNAYCTVMPSRNWEAFPLVVLESYAACKPVIGTRIAGLEDLIEPGETGWLVPPDDARALARSLQTALTGAPAVASMGRKARQTAERHAWPAVAAMHLALYRSVMNDRLIRAG
jgi:glycosyltransferase involved in cell wall biosynthesis